MNTKQIFVKLLNLLPSKKFLEYDLKTVKSLCFLGYGYRIGDLLTASFLFREIKKIRPDIFITIAVEPQYAEFVSSNKYIDKIKILPESSFRLFCFLKISKFDVIINLPWDRYSKLDMLIYRFSNVNAFIFETSKYKYDFIKFFVVWNKEEHIVNFLAKIPKLFGNNIINSDYELSLPEKYEKNFSNFIKNNFNNLANCKTLVFNPEAFETVRTLNKKRVLDIVNEISKEIYNLKVILLSYKQKYNFPKRKNFIVYETNNIFNSVAAIKNADFVLSVDTATVHIADYYKKKTVALYSDDKFSIKNNFIRFSSLNPKTIRIKSDNDKTVNDIETNIIINSLKKLFTI